MRKVQRQRMTKISVSRIVRPIAASFKMPEIEEGANTSTNASPGPSCLTPQALADSMMNSMMESVKASVSKLRSGDPPTIYIVPQRIRQVNEVAYEPQMVSIGPYHHGKKSLQGMEENKWLYLHSFLSRNPNHRLQDYLEAIEKLEDEARSYYSDNIGPQVGNEFVKMMVLDACFIVELFVRFFLFTQKEKDPVLLSENKFFLHSSDFKDPICQTIVMRRLRLIGYDLLLLENQIPFFLLQRIFIMACRVDVPHLLAEMALHFFDQFMPRNKKIKVKDSYCHLLHLFHSHLFPTPTNSKEEPNLACNPKIKSVLKKLKNLLPCSNKDPLPITEPREMIPCTTDLQLAGVKLKKNKESNSILNLKFSDGELEIPFLVIRDSSETLFQNLVAFGQCYPGANIYFTTYLVFMDFLVNTAEDVALLHRNGIIDNLLGSDDDDVTHLFTRVVTGIFRTYLSDVKDNVQKHCENTFNKQWASLKRDYFTDPWTIISVVNASIILMFTITQTFFTVFPFQPWS